MIHIWLAIAATAAIQGPVSIGVYGEVKSPGAQKLSQGSLAELVKAVERAQPRVSSSRYLMLCRANGAIERTKMVGGSLDWEIAMPGPKPAPPQEGDLVYVPPLSEAIVLHKGKASYLVFEGPKVHIDDVLGVGAHSRSPMAVLPRFLERFQGPDLAGRPAELRFDYLSQSLPMRAGRAWEPMHFTRREEGVVQCGDLIILEGAEPYAAAIAQAKPVDGASWIRAWFPPFWHPGEDFVGTQKVPLARKPGSDLPAALLLVGPFDYRPPEQPEDLFRLYASDLGAAGGRPAQEPVVESRRKVGRFEIERLDRTRFFVHGLSNGKLRSVELNTVAGRAEYDVQAKRPGNPLSAENLAIDDRNAAVVRKLAGQRVVQRLYPISFANFFVELDRIGAANLAKPQAGGLWRSSPAAYVQYEQDFVDLDPKKSAKRTAPVQYWVYTEVLKAQKLRPVENGPLGLKMLTVPVVAASLAPGKPSLTKLGGGSLILRAGGGK